MTVALGTDPDGLATIADRAVKAYLRIHPSMCGRYEELLSAAHLGVCHAARSFDPSRGVPLGAYAYRRAQGAVLDCLRDGSPMSRTEHKRGLTVADLPPERLCISIEHLAELTGVPGLAIKDPHDDISQVDARETLYPLIRELPEREREVVYRVDLRGETLASVGRLFGVTEARICQIRKEAHRHMRAAATGQVAA